MQICPKCYEVSKETDDEVYCQECKFYGEFITPDIHMPMSAFPAAFGALLDRLDTLEQALEEQRALVQRLMDMNNLARP